MSRNRIVRVVTLALLSAVAGCTSLRSHWPFAQHAAPPPVVTELEVGLPEGTPPVVLQYWQRTTLVVDLTNVGGQGHITLRPAAGKQWPVRLAFRMAPRRFEQLEVRGAQRLLLPVAAGSAEPVVAELPPGLYDANTPLLTISWGAAGAF